MQGWVSGQSYSNAGTCVGSWTEDNSLSGFGLQCWQPGTSGVLQVGSVCLRVNVAQRKNKAKKTDHRGDQRARKQTQVLRIWFESLDSARSETRTYL